MWPFLFVLSVVLLGGVYWTGRRREAAAQQEIKRCQRDLAHARELQVQSTEQAHARQEALFDSMVEGVLLLDSQFRIQIANPAIGELFGTQHVIRGQTILEAFRRHELAELAKKAAEDGQVAQFELEISGPKPRTVEVNAAAILDRQKKTQGVLIVFHDLTRLKQLENIRSEFVANVSHELRTPLSIIKGYLETLLDLENSELSSKFLRVVQRHTDRLIFLIEDLLTISQLESGQVRLNRAPVLLRELAGHILEELQPRAQEKKIVMVNEIPEEMSALADPDRIQQVLWNLVDNAVKYGRPEGFAGVGARLRDNQVEVWVRDDGPGIPLEAQERVFERFYRVDRARSRDQGGTGLGLSIVKHIVQSHGGKVWLESKPGQGTTFYFSLPVEGPCNSPS